MNNNLTKFGLAVAVFALLATIILKPIVYNENEYTVIFVNASEHNITSAVITGVGENSGVIGPINVGMVNDYIFTPDQNGILKYSIMQNEHELIGIINPNLKKGDVGEVFVVVDEMYKVRVLNKFDI